MAIKGDGVVRRIDKELYTTLQDLAKKNNTSIRQASLDAAKVLKNMNGKTITKEIRF